MGKVYTASSAQNVREFTSSANRNTLTYGVYIAASGSAKLQARVDGNWVDVPDTSVTASTVATVYASRGLTYRFVITGDAIVEKGD